VGPGISYGTYKLTRTPRIKKKKKKTQFCLCKIFECVMEYSSLFRMKKKLSSMWAWEINVHCIVYKKKPIRLTGCLVSPGISYGTRKLTRIPRIKKKKKKKKTQFCLCKIFECVMEYSYLFRMKKKLSSMWAWENNVHCIIYKKNLREQRPLLKEEEEKSLKNVGLDF
jgi:ribulose bisphosphate carboxylase small subunit